MENPDAAFLAAIASLVAAFAALIDSIRRKP